MPAGNAKMLVFLYLKIPVGRNLTTIDTFLNIPKSRFLKVEGLFKKYHQRIASLSKRKVESASKGKIPSMHGALPDPLVAGGHSTHANTSSKEVEEVCPICLSDLVEGESMIVCREGCQNRLHHHCMAVCKL